MNNKLLPKIAFFISFIAVGACSYATLPWSPLSSSNKSLINVTYCGDNPSGLCVISFGLDSQGRMLLNFITPQASFPDFYVIIKRLKKDNKYECQKVSGFPTSVYCIGNQMPLGEKVDLDVYSTSQGDLIAKGNLTILFYALQSPFTVYSTSTNEIMIGAKTSTPRPADTQTIVEASRTPSFPSYP